MTIEPVRQDHPPHSDDRDAGPELEILPGRVAGLFLFSELFSRPAPVELEVGIGKGRFLLEQARARLEVNFLGLEWSLKHLRVTKVRAERMGLANVRLYRADARHVLADLVPDESLQRLHIYCPDPWPKKRHRKRRLFNGVMAPHMERVLQRGGFLHISTDVLPYFKEISEVLREHTNLERGNDPLFPTGSSEAQTHYEVKYVRAGCIIHRASYVRVNRSRR